MSENYGKKFNVTGNDGIRPRGVCTGFCPILCKNAAVIWCACKNKKYDNKGGTYYTNYNSVVCDNRTPDL